MLGRRISPIPCLLLAVLAPAGRGAGAAAADAAPGAGIRLRHGSPVRSVAASPDGRTIATAGDDGVVRLWEARTGKERLAFAGDGGKIHALATGPDGRLLVTGGADGMVRLWDAAIGKSLKVIPAHAAEARSVAVSADASLIASGGMDKTLCLWDAAGRLVHRISPHLPRPADHANSGAVQSVALSPDGSLLASAHGPDDGAVRVFDTRDGREVRRLQAHRIGSPAVAFSRDGAMLAVGGGERSSVVVYETATWGWRRRLDAPQAWWYPPAFSPDGRRLACGAADALVVWDLETGRIVHTLKGHDGAVSAVAYLDQHVVSGGADGTANVHHLPPAARQEPAEAANAGGLEGPWATLAVEDAGTAYDAICALAAAVDRAVPFLQQRLQPEASADEAKVRRLIKELDHEQFMVRERATRELAAAGGAAEPYLADAMAARPSVEAAQRLEVLLKSVRESAPDPELLRALRAVEVLERIGTPQARQVLSGLSAGPAGSRLQRHARAALARLQRD